MKEYGLEANKKSMLMAIRDPEKQLTDLPMLTVVEQYEVSRHPPNQKDDKEAAP